jgi:hypothetical protein
MSEAHGGYCGAFALPKTPFVSQPFFGHYSSTGGRGPGGTITGPSGVGGTTTPGTTTPGTTTTPPATSTPTPGANTPFDPNQYETPPQGQPKVQKPPSDNGGGAQAPAH